MTERTPRNPDSHAPKNGSDNRQDRLKAALKANMARRKAQMRARAGTGQGGAADEAGKDKE
ncbi:hypothetical protein [Roseovarius amoyensis]|uniref:hypothetical protein n=1 Tax=Roseovarius amoyensis TaxID=2211448 RepID=UPI000DBE8D71|nr:hypothetical protein [Roseovarius amoyensis]